MLSPQERIIRITRLLQAIRDGFYSQSSNESNTITPLFILAGVVKIPSPVFHSFIDVKRVDGQFKVIGVPDALRNGWIDGDTNSIFIQESERLGATKPVTDSRLTRDWQTFLQTLGLAQASGS